MNEENVWDQMTNWCGRATNPDGQQRGNNKSNEGCEIRKASGLSKVCMEMIIASGNQHFESRSTNIPYLDFSLKPAVFGCLINAIAPPPIALESCSNPQKIWQVFWSALKKIFFGWGLQIFYEWCRKWSSFWTILAHVTWPRAKSLSQSISLKFSLETRLSPSQLGLWWDFLVFLVQKLWSKINKLINYLFN